MRVYIVVIFSFFLSLFLSCQKQETTNSASFYREKLYNKKLMDSLDNRIFNYGDTVAYFELQTIHYIGEQRFTGFLYHALIMSNKYNYKRASNDVHEILTSNESVLDSKTREMADEYLLKSK